MLEKVGSQSFIVVLSDARDVRLQDVLGHLHDRSAIRTGYETRILGWS